MSKAAMHRHTDEMVHLLGKRTDPNPYLLPNGAQRVALNVWMTKQGYLSKRRGFSRWSQTLQLYINKIFPYGTGFIAHIGADTLSRIDSAGTVNSINSGFGNPDTQANWKTRACIAGKDFFFNSNDYVYRMSGTGVAPVKAGGLIAPSFDNQAVGTVLSGTGFLADGFTTAYRYAIGQVNSYGREILGPVSGRLNVSNQSGTTGWVTTESKNVTLRALLPSEVTTSHFIRVWRAEQIEVGSTPDDDLQVVYEKVFSTTDVSNLYVEFTDVVPDANRGGFIYTAPNAGEGILQNNDPPPYAAEIVEHRNRVWYLNTRQPHSFDLQILSVGGSAGIQDGDTLQLLGSLNITLTAKTVLANPGDYLLVTSGTVSYNIEQTAMNLVTALNKMTSNTAYWGQYVSGPLDTPGKVNIYMRSRGVVGFVVAAGPGAQRDCWNPSLLPGLHTVSLTRAGGANVTATVASGTQSFRVGESVVIAPGSGNFGTGPFVITAIDITGPSTTFDYHEVGSNVTLAAQTAVLLNGPNTLPSNVNCQSTQEVMANRAYYSKPGEFDAVPRTNYIDLGAQDKDIVAAVSANDQLWVWKRDGVIRVVGDGPSNFDPIDVDRTVVCNARESVVKFLGAPVGLTDRGFMQATIQGLELLSQPIQKEMLDQMVGTQGGYLEANCFTVPYDSEGLCILMFESGRDLATSARGLVSTTGYVYSAKANDWTDFSFDPDLGYGNGKTCGAVLVDSLGNGTLYFGDRYDTAHSNTFIYKERKSRTAADFKDTYGDASDIAIKSICSPAIITDHAPGWSKLFQEVVFLFDGTQPASFTVADACEWGSGGTHTVLATSGYASRIWPFVDASRGRVLLLTITHNTISEDFNLAGLQVSYALEGLEAER